MMFITEVSGGGMERLWVVITTIILMGLQVLSPFVVVYITYRLVWKFKLENETKTKESLVSQATIDQARKLVEITLTPEVKKIVYEKLDEFQRISKEYQTTKSLSSEDAELFFDVQDGTLHLLGELELTVNLIKEEIISPKLLKALIGKGFLSLYKDLLQHVIYIRRGTGGHSDVWKGVVELMNIFNSENES